MSAQPVLRSAAFPSARLGRADRCLRRARRAPRPPSCSRGAGSGMPGLQERGTAVIIVDHGSRRAESNHALEELAQAYRAATGRGAVEIAHMELAEPSIADAVAQCVSQGHRDITVAPYFLSRGRHISADIPALVEEAGRQHPGTTFTIAEPLGIDPLILQLLEQRVQEAQGRALLQQHTQQKPAEGAEQAEAEQALCPS